MIAVIPIWKILQEVDLINKRGVEDDKGDRRKIGIPG